jgi:hypothetical protein
MQGSIRLVVSIAKRYIGPAMEFFELVSDGNMPLIRAVEKFDVSRGNKFSSIRVRQSLSWLARAGSLEDKGVQMKIRIHYRDQHTGPWAIAVRDVEQIPQVGEFIAPAPIKAYRVVLTLHIFF